ncbi:PadR family transcriptional regulator [Roseivirga misakiensis]|uniref:PadR family transcriptional regulator n=1 Tax=Roseivirga misakiensis TaxID=1563681 RepID=A0A1E5SL72_9BACT|nr:PadR family transcriptional regulator [Roseivirga misakiensis]OEJ99851.1 PadR family transcriptional regulator [Roseivirga misakiensis]
MYSKELIRGTLRTIILKLLSENGEMYGYEITQKVKELSSNEISLTFGALYPTLHKLEKEGIVTTKSREVDNRTRKYYALTDAGNEAARIKIEEYFQFAKMMNLIMISDGD